MKKAEEAREVRQCHNHHGKAVSKHACGAWLCSACLDEEDCPSCNKPLHVPKPKDEEPDKEENETKEPDAPLPSPPKERPRRREDEANRDFNRL
jgi:hypothetical protein